MEGLWKKETTPTGVMYVDLFACSTNGQLKLNGPVSSSAAENKNNHISTMFRLQGNEAFRKNEIKEAMDLYNRSLCFAEVGTKNVSLVYANRASCFLELKQYAEALKDIELAKQSNYPAELMPKLTKRQAECYRWLNFQPKTEKFQPKLSFKPKEAFPCLADVLDLQQSSDFGRLVVANSDIGVGKIVLVEPNFASVATNGGNKTCAKCLKMNANFITCSKCVDVLYCSSECLNCDAVHEFTCGQFQSVSGSMKLYIRTVLIAIGLFKNIDDLMNFVEDAIAKQRVDNIPKSFSDLQSQYRVFLSLHTSLNVQNKKDFIIDAQKIYMQLISTPLVKELFQSKKKQRFLQHLVLQHVLVTSRNRFQYESEENQLKITDIAAMACLVNHSCAPNVFHHVIDNQIVFITVRPIQTTIHYVFG